MKRVDPPSEGFRDQLFLTLRLVMIEGYAAETPPLPLVADDLLQTFDDDRTAYAYQVSACRRRYVSHGRWHIPHRRRDIGHRWRQWGAEADNDTGGPKRGIEHYVILPTMHDSGSAQ